jgi:hypothetical protein
MLTSFNGMNDEFIKGDSGSARCGAIPYHTNHTKCKRTLEKEDRLRGFHFPSKNIMISPLLSY